MSELRPQGRNEIKQLLAETGPRLVAESTTDAGS